MEEQQFDNLARLIATKTSRRQMLKVIAGTALGGWFIGSGRELAHAAGGGNSTAAHFCTLICGCQDCACHNTCTSQAAQCANGTGACTGIYNACGPTSGITACPDASGGYCCPTSAVPYSTVTTCGPNGTCIAISCVSGFTVSNGQCVRTCTPIGNSCAANSDCCSGLCDPTSKTCVSCVPDGDECIAPIGYCCSGICDPTTNTCVSCIPSGDTCINPQGYYCCTGLCDSTTNTCVDCIPSGHTCGPGGFFCCSGICNTATNTCA